MTDNERKDIKKAGELERRSVLVGGAAAAVTAVLPEAATAQNQCVIQAKSAAYTDPTYLTSFNRDAYSRGNVLKAANVVRGLFTNRADLTWGSYQREVVPKWEKWGSTQQKALAAWTNWPIFVKEAQDDLVKQPAIFSGANVMDPFNPGRVAPNLKEHLDEVIRIALWDHNTSERDQVPIRICVGGKKSRHHGLRTIWDMKDASTLSSLTIEIDCPDGGWQGWTLWPNNPNGDHIARFVASWVIPPPPKKAEGQIIFIFNGLESKSKSDSGIVGGILQPVLQWTGVGWEIRSWYVRADCDKNSELPPSDQASDQSNLARDKRCYSRAVSRNADGSMLSTGQKITGTIEGGQDGNGRFNYTCSLSIGDQGQSDTILPLNDIPELVYAVCAVESYGVNTHPDDYPSAPIAMTDIGLAVQQSANSPRQSISPIKWAESARKGGDYTPKASHQGSSIEFKMTWPN